MTLDRPGEQQVALAPDPLIEALKKDVDRTQLRENLRLTVEERIRKHDRALETMLELRRAGAARQSTACPICGRG